MSELPKNWAAATLGELITLNYGKSLPASKREAGPYNVFGANGIVGSHTEAITEAPAIIVGRKGSIGEVHLSEEPCFPIDTTYFVDAYHGNDPRFIAYMLRDLPLTQMNRATAVPGLSRVDAYSLCVGLPPLAEQKRIVDKIMRLETRISYARNQLDKIPVLIEKYKAWIMGLGCSGELTKKWRESEKLSKPTVVRLGDVAKGFNYGTSSKSSAEGKVPVLRMGNIKSGRLDWTDLVYTSASDEIEKYKLEEGDVLFNRTNSPELVGKTAVYKGEREAIFAGYLIRVKCGPELLPDYLAYCLNGPAGRKYTRKVKSDGVSQSNINAKKLAAFEFLLPTIEEQTEIVRRVNFTVSWLERVSASHAAATKLLPNLNAAILSKAFRGQLVPQSPSDEPASILLAGIRKKREAAPKTKRRRSTREKSMKKDPKELLLLDSESWPETGLPYEEVAKRNPIAHEQLRDAIFAILSEEKPKLQQVFDKKAECMLLKRVKI